MKKNLVILTCFVATSVLFISFPLLLGKDLMAGAAKVELHPPVAAVIRLGYMTGRLKAAPDNPR